MSAVDFSRVLVLSSSVFNYRTGGGVTLSNLFRGWPRDRIAAAHSDSEMPTTDICDNYFRLGDEELGRAGVFRLLGRGPRERATLSPRLIEWVRAFKPDVIYTLLGSLGYVRLADKLAHETGAAVVPHMMDDWPSVIYGDSLPGRLMRRRLDRKLRALFRKSHTLLAISPAMASEYSSRYGKKFMSVSNPVDRDKWMRDIPPRRTGEQKLLYVGSVLAEAQLSALSDIAAAVAGINTGSARVKLEIATPNHENGEMAEAFARWPFVKIRDVPGEDGIADLFASADLLLLPANFSARSTRYLRLSNPTKVPAYMASGVPIFVYAPPELDIVKRAHRDGWGVVVETNDADRLTDAIVNALNDRQLRQRVIENARVTFARDHDGGRVRNEFRTLLGAAGAPT